MKIVGPNNENAEKAVGDRLYEILRRITSATPLQEGMLFTVRNHFTSIYPGSKHYSPDKVQPLSKSDGSLYGKASEASIDIDVPGITRAYHDLNIKPRFRKALTIPIRREAFGKKASDFEDTFVAKKKGKEGAYIAQRKGDSVIFLFKLVRDVFQRRDERLMPSDAGLQTNIASRLVARLQF